MIVVLLILGLLAIVFPLAPLGAHSGGQVAPDLLLPLLVAWTVRRPDTSLLLVTALLLLLADFALERPVGLWALISLLIIEGMRSQGIGFRDQNFLLEWASFAAALVAGLLVQALILSLALVPQPPAGRMVAFFALTVVCYPLIVLLLNWVVQVRFPKPKDRSQRLGEVR